MKNLDDLKTAGDFIEFFEGIREEEWFEGTFFNDDGTKKCALGHCGGGRFGEATPASVHALISIFTRVDSSYNSVSRINDGKNPNFQQPTPKQRILAALREIETQQLVNLEAT